MSTAAPAQIEGVEHKYADLPDFRVHYAEAGDPSADPILLLHGWPQHWYEWHEVIPPLAAAGYRVLAPDLRGFGWSGAPDGPYSPEVFASDQVALLDALDIDTAKVAGHDWGGYTSVLLAALHGDRFASAVCFNAPHLWPNVTPSVALETWRLWYVALNATGLTVGALAACAQVTCQMVATALGIETNKIEVVVEGDLDLRGTLGVSREANVGFDAIRLRFEIDAPDATEEQMQELETKTERYCTVLQTLTNPPPIESSRTAA